MKLLKSTFMASALILGTASMAIAQDKSYGSGTQAKDMAVDKAKDMATDKAKDMAGDKAGMVDPAMKVGEHMMKGDSVKDAAMKAGQSEAKSMMKDKAKSYGSGAVAGEAASMDGKDAMTAGKVMMQGGSTQDAAMAVAKDNAKDAMMGKAEGMVKDQMMHQGTIKTSAPSYGSATTAVTSAPAAATTVNCPYGTTAQANGTCMITGDYKPRS